MCRLSGTLAVRIAKLPVSRRRNQATKEPCAFARRAKSQGEALAVGVGAKTTILASTDDTLAFRAGGLAVTVCFEPFSGQNCPWRAWPPREKVGLLAQAEGSMPEGLRKTPGK